MFIKKFKDRNPRQPSRYSLFYYKSNIILVFIHFLNFVKYQQLFTLTVVLTYLMQLHLEEPEVLHGGCILSKTSKRSVTSLKLPQSKMKR